MNASWEQQNVQHYHIVTTPLDLTPANVMMAMLKTVLPVLVQFFYIFIYPI